VKEDWACNSHLPRASLACIEEFDIDSLLALASILKSGNDGCVPRNYYEVMRNSNV
jgi:hypothetical protein